MKSVRACVLALLVAAAPQADDLPEPSAKDPVPVLGFYPDWRRSSFPPESVDWERLTHAAMAFALPREDGSIDASSIHALPGLVRAGHEHKRRVILSIGGANGSEPFRVLARDPEKRRRFVREALALVERHGLDGLDIDWEHFTGGREVDEASRRGLLDLLRDLHPELRARDKTLSASVFASDWYGKNYDPAIMDHVSWIHVMAYDHAGSWLDAPGPDSSTGQAVEALAYWERKVGRDRRRQIWLAVPFFGKRFPRDYRKGMDVEGVDYAKVLETFPGAAGADHVRDDAGETFYNGRRTLARKVRYVRENGFGGIAIWELSADAREGPARLLPVIARQAGR